MWRNNPKCGETDRLEMRDKGNSCKEKKRNKWVKNALS